MQFTAILFASLASSAFVELSKPTTQFLNLTALTALNGESVFQCWQLPNPFIESQEPGLKGSRQLSLGELGNGSFNVIPARFDGGFHHAPAFQYVFFTTGMAHISLYKGKEEVTVPGGKHGLVIAADTADRSTHGHRTRYPGAENTISLEIPIRDPGNFKYKALHAGACGASESFVGI
ncbi:hypothetical protein QQS21_003364 [Conoideocrella luteorostrata]|uniref:Small secreted protein n=1 Tax=Conoideocrella luteorostrata TaxID=1105319 RepID=A0AAJ0CWE0_9HYPO|nr:hypothetical protein QQS21_003364 [Conoideocrella luteorostrata]